MNKNFIISKKTKFNKDINSFHITSKSCSKLFRNKNNTYSNELIKSVEDMHIQTEFILKKYAYYKKLLGDKLNIIHNKDLSEAFWTKAFNLYLIRLIMALWIRFNKFKDFDIHNNYICILDEPSFYYPTDTPESAVFFMNNDYYQEQIFSIYINIFYPTHNLSKYNIIKNTNPIKDISFEEYDFSSLQLEKLTLLDSYIDKNILNKLDNNIKNFYLTKTNISNITVDEEKRKQLSFNSSLFIDDFDKFFLNSISYLLPISYLEGFNYLYTSYNQIDVTKAKYILCENWLSNDKLSIFLAIAKEKGVLHYALEHGFNFYIQNNFASFIHKMADKYISYGWNNTLIKNLIPSGMWRYENPQQYKYDANKKNVFFISYGEQYPYDTDFAICHYTNNEAQESYKHNIKTLFSKIENKQDIIFKRYPQYEGYDNSDNEYLNIFKECQVTYNDNELGYSNLGYINFSKLVIIGNTGSVFFECIYNGVPTVTLYNPNFVFIEPKYKILFEKLEKVGILHTSPENMASFINSIIDDPFKWWYSNNVQSSVQDLLNLTTLPSKEFSSFINNLYNS